MQPLEELLGRSGEHVHACAEFFKDLEAKAAVCSLSEKYDDAHDSGLSLLLARISCLAGR